jgi:flagellar basal-body rod modification protein FlgD
MATDLNRTAGNTYSLQSIVPALPTALQDNTDPTSNPTNDFLKLMVAQLQNQDPEKPVDGTALISQLTQMQSAFAVQRMSFLSQASQQVTTSAALLGRTVFVKDPNTGAQLSGKVTSIDYSGKDPAITVNQQSYPLTAVSRVDV